MNMKELGANLPMKDSTYEKMRDDTDSITKEVNFLMNMMMKLGT